MLGGNKMKPEIMVSAMLYDVFFLGIADIQENRKRHLFIYKSLCPPSQGVG